MEDKTPPLILLCAGASTRMGFPKGLMEWQGEPLLIHQIESFLQLEFGRVVLVLGHHHERYRECLALKSYERVHIVMNHEPERGQFSSLKEGVALIPQASWAFLLPIDCPAPHPEVWSALWQARGGQISALIPSMRKKSGHPLLLGAKMLEAIRTAPADSRLDSLLQSCPEDEKKYVEVADERIHANINTLDRTN